MIIYTVKTDTYAYNFVHARSFIFYLFISISYFKHLLKIHKIVDILICIIIKIRRGIDDKNITFFANYIKIINKNILENFNLYSSFGFFFISLKL